MTDQDSLSPKAKRDYCLQKTSDLFSYVDNTLAIVDRIDEIPEDIVIDGTFYFKSIFGPDSEEYKEFETYRGWWNSIDREVRKKFLKRLYYGLSSAKKKLSAPEEYYSAYGWGNPDNLRKQGNPIDKQLNIHDNGSAFSKRILELCRRTDMSMAGDCNDAIAFYLRKILECSIVSRFEKENRRPDLIENGKMIGLEKLLNKSKVSKSGFLKDNLVDNILKCNKLLLDESVHSFQYDPPKKDIQECVTNIGLALSQLKVNEL